MYASLLGACPESLLVDNDVLGAAMRMTRGIEVNDNTLSFDTIRQVCLGGEGHYLGTDQTISVMQTEYLYPDCSDRDSPIAWEGNGKPDLMAKAVVMRDQILSSHFPGHISEETDRALRDDFPIALERQAMGHAV